MYFKLALYQLKKRPFVNLVVICQFVIAIYLICMIAARLPTYFTATRIIGGACKGESYYLYRDTGYWEYINDMQEGIYDKYSLLDEELLNRHENKEITDKDYEIEIKKNSDAKKNELSKYSQVPINPDVLPHVKNDSYLAYSNLVADNSIYVDVISKDLSDVVKYNMKFGNWLSDAKENEKYINLVAFNGSGYSIGDIIDLEYSVVEHDKEKDYYYEIRKPAVQGKIVGIIKDKYTISMGRMTSFNNGQATLNLDDFLSIPELGNLITVYNPQSSKYNGMKIDEDYLKRIVTLKDDVAVEEINEFKKACSENHYGFAYMKDNFDYTYLKEMESFRNDIIFLISASLLSIVALIGISALGVSREVKNYSIYYLNGMSWKGCMKINIVFMSIIIVVSTAISSLIKLYYAIKEYFYDLDVVNSLPADISVYFEGSIRFSDYFYYTKGEVLAILIVVAVSFVSSLIIPYITFKKNTPVSILKGK